MKKTKKKTPTSKNKFFERLFKRGKLRTAITIVSAVLCFVLLVVGIIFLDKIFVADKERGENATDVRTTYFDGKPYLKNTIDSYLIIGVDNYEYGEEISSSGFYNNSHSADFLVLLAVDVPNKTYTLIHINRDTMCDVNVLGIGGSSIGTNRMQIALAHTYGDGMSLSSRNTVNAVSTLLNGISIQNYITLTMTAVGQLTDYVGGVEVQLAEDQDYTTLNEDWTAGAKITLSGEDAVDFVRARMTVDDGTNISRMFRQCQFMDGLANNINSREEAFSDAFLQTAYDTMEPYMETNCGIGDFQDLMSLLSTYQNNGMRYAEGQTSLTEDGYMQFTDYEESMLEIVKEVYYTQLY